MISGERVKLMKVSGEGRMFIADDGKKMIAINLGAEDIIVNGEDILALEETCKWEICAIAGAGAMSGGLFHIKVTGPGMVAIGTHFDPLVFAVDPDNDLFTDPHATVCWSGALSPKVKTDVSVKSLIGKGSGEEFQLYFQGGAGFVVVQPFEEHIAS